MIADATGAPNAISMPSTLARDSIRRLPANIHTIPAIAMPIASQVRGAMGERSTAHARNAVVSGATARTISVFAVDVSVSASMKQTNIVAHIAPDSSPGAAGAADRADEVAPDEEQEPRDGERREEAPPERDLEPPVSLQLGRQVTRHDAGDAPQRRRDHHQDHGAAVQRTRRLRLSFALA